MKKAKRFLALMLSVLMLVSVLSIGASALSGEPVMNLKNNKTCLGLTSIAETMFAKTFGCSYYAKQVWPTINSLRTLGRNIYLVDYQYDYNIDDLMAKGASSAVELLAYASSHICHNAYKFKMGEWGLGCSAYRALNTEGDYIMGRNFDYMDAPCYIVWTHATKDSYATVSMVDGTFMLTTDHLNPSSVMGRTQTLLAPYLCLDGMNEKGLAISILQIHADGTKQNNGKTDMFATAAIRCCLDKCATVNEAIAMFDRFDIQDTIALGNSLGCCFHYLLTDATGDAAVIEFVNGQMNVIRDSDLGDYLHVTNYYLTPGAGDGMEAYDPEGMERFEMISEKLAENNGVLSFAESFDLLSDVHLNYRHDNGLYDITTLWSCVYNNTDLSMALAARMDYSKIYTFDIDHPMCVYSIDSVDVSMPKEGIGLR